MALVAVVVVVVVVSTYLYDLIPGFRIGNKVCEAPAFGQSRGFAFPHDEAHFL